MARYNDSDETIIVINEADKRDGFFVWSSTKATDYSRLLRRIGGVEKLLKLTTHTKGKRVTAWVCHVPIEFLSNFNWGVARKRTHGRKDAFKKVESQAA